MAGELQHDGAGGFADLGCVSHGGQVDMTGLNLVRHHLQQAKSHADFLPGGESRTEFVTDDDLSVEDAADGVRDDLRMALDTLEGLLDAQAGAA